MKRTILERREKKGKGLKAGGAGGTMEGGCGLGKRSELTKTYRLKVSSLKDLKHDELAQRMKTVMHEELVAPKWLTRAHADTLDAFIKGVELTRQRHSEAENAVKEAVKMAERLQGLNSRADVVNTYTELIRRVKSKKLTKLDIERIEMILKPQREKIQD